MTSQHHHRESCRLCDSRHLTLAVPLAPSAIADAYLPPELAESSRTRYPLDLYLCRECGHVQLLDVVSADLLFREYTFRTSSSTGLVDHFRNYAEEVRQLATPGPDPLVVEIGSNDGSLLRFFQSHGYRTIGIDPAQRIAAEATAGGVQTMPEFFTSELAARLVARHGAATIVAANNVFAHIDQLGDVADGVRKLLSPDGLFVFEVSYLVDIVERLLFDTVYHEHLCYHSVKPLVRFLASHGLSLTDVRRIPAKGGSIRCYVHRADAELPPKSTVAQLLDLEKAQGMDQLATFQRFTAEIAELNEQVLAAIRSLRSPQSRVAGFGASATVTTLLHQFGLAEHLEFLVDDNTAKWGLLSPGHHLQVRSPPALNEGIGGVVVLAWPYASQIMERHRWFREQGGRFVVPLPKVQVHGPPVR